jgi:hypothetical protein
VITAQITELIQNGDFSTPEIVEYGRGHKAGDTGPEDDRVEHVIVRAGRRTEIGRLSHDLHWIGTSIEP